MRFVIVVDAQSDFIDPAGALPVAGAAGLAAPMQAWLARLDPANVVGVLFTFDTHDAATYPSMPEAAEFPPHCLTDTPGWESVLDLDGVPAAIPSFVLRKGVFDMWAEADVLVEPRRPGGQAVPREAFFAALQARGVTDVTVIGVAADYCVRWAIDGLHARGFRVTVPAALTRGIARQIEVVARDDFAGALTIL